MAVSKSTIFFRNNPKSHANKLRIQRKINKRPTEVARRVELNRLNRQNPASKVGDNKDVSHFPGGKIKLEFQTKNRARKKRPINVK